MLANFRPTYHNWQRGKVGTLSRDQLERISLLLGIHKGLKLLFSDEAAGLRWFKSANRDLPFGGAAPLDRALGAVLTTFIGASLHRRMARDQMTALKRSRIRRKTHRLIATKYPTIGVFDDLASIPQSARAFILEALTNDRLAAQRINLLQTRRLLLDLSTPARVS